VRSRRAKVVFVNRYFHPDESATSRVLSDLAFRLATLGINIAVVTSRQLYDQPQASLPATEVISGVTVHRVMTSTRGRGHLAGRAADYLSFHICAAAKLLAILKPGDVVIAKTDPPLISIVTSHIARLRRATLINWLQDLFPEVAVALDMRAIPPWAARILLAHRNRSLSRAAVNVVLGERMRDHLLALGIDPKRIRIVPNWADTRQIAPQAASHSATRQTLDLAGRFVLGYSGNLGRAHEFETLLGAARLLRTDERFAFLITGGGAKAAGLRAAVEAEHLNSFHFLPHQPPELLADCLSAADVHLISLLPALEGLIVPSKLYGILAAGRPAIFIGDTDGEVARVVREHQCGTAVAVGDSGRLAAELRSMADDPQRVAAMSRNARHLAERRHTSDHAVEDWSQMLRGVAPDAVGTFS
jgi:colanic acid biosynthesis glycosyl transferase WcaI